MPVPTLTEVTDYVSVDGVPDAYSASEIEGAYAAERSAQRSVCKVPGDEDDWPDDLAEALMRRVTHNLTLRRLPLGVMGSVTEGSVPLRVGGTDAEVRRLEGPYRKRVVG